MRSQHLLLLCLSCRATPEPVIERAPPPQSGSPLLEGQDTEMVNIEQAGEQIEAAILKIAQEYRLRQLAP